MPRTSEATERTCIVTRQQRPASELVRFVVGPDGALVADIRRRLPGRGVWVTRSKDLVERAEKKRLFEKQFDGRVTVEPGLADRVDALLLSAAAGALALARKAGTLVGGFGKVESAVRAGEAMAVIHAAEAGEDGVAKLAAAARRRFGPRQLPVIRCFHGEQLDLAFGRTNVIHAALLAGPASDNVLARVGDLVGYRSGGDPSVEAGTAKFDALTETA